MSAKQWSLWFPGLVLVGLIALPAGNLLFQAAHAADGTTPPVKMTKDQDHQRIMDLLGMKEMRRYRSPSRSLDLWCRR